MRCLASSSAASRSSSVSPSASTGSSASAASTTRPSSSYASASRSSSSASTSSASSSARASTSAISSWGRSSAEAHSSTPHPPRPRPPLERTGIFVVNLILGVLLRPLEQLQRFLLSLPLVIGLVLGALINVHVPPSSASSARSSSASSVSSTAHSSSSVSRSSGAPQLRVPLLPVQQLACVFRICIIVCVSHVEHTCSFLDTVDLRILQRLGLSHEQQFFRLRLLLLRQLRVLLVQQLRDPLCRNVCEHPPLVVRQCGGIILDDPHQRLYELFEQRRVFQQLRDSFGHPRSSSVSAASSSTARSSYLVEHPLNQREWLTLSASALLIPPAIALTTRAIRALCVFRIAVAPLPPPPQPMNQPAPSSSLSPFLPFVDSSRAAAPAALTGALTTLSLNPLTPVHLNLHHDLPALHVRVLPRAPAHDVHAVGVRAHGSSNACGRKRCRRSCLRCHPPRARWRWARRRGLWGLGERAASWSADGNKEKEKEKEAEEKGLPTPPPIHPMISTPSPSITPVPPSQPTTPAPPLPNFSKGRNRQSASALRTTSCGTYTQSCSLTRARSESGGCKAEARIWCRRAQPRPLLLRPR
ncbi:hypothetical protein DFH09DRAFT_1380511 [Mycena vulgaris]|nr:hypothetical protein DFH09DRAFT_1380511 [Mycena vulgaris]